MHIKDIQSIHHSQPKYWENSYKSGEIPWDLGKPTSIFKNWIRSQKKAIICMCPWSQKWMGFASFCRKIS